jgi:hypothetical protein
MDKTERERERERERAKKSGRTKNPKLRGINRDPLSLSPLSTFSLLSLPPLSSL